MARGSLLHLLSIPALAVTLLASPALAQEAAPSAPSAQETEEAQELQSSILAIEPKQIPVDQNAVQRVLDTLPKVIQMVRELDRENKVPESSDVEENPAYLFAPYISDPQNAERIEAMFRDIGFDGYSTWANAVHSISLAADAASFGPTADLEVQKNQAMEDIRADENLNETEKAAAISDIENEFTALAQFEPLPGNVEAVRPFLDRIRDAGVGGIGEPDDE